MYPTESVNSRLNDLKVKLEQVNRVWTIKDYESLMKFYINRRLKKPFYLMYFHRHMYD